MTTLIKLKDVGKMYFEQQNQDVYLNTERISEVYRRYDTDGDDYTIINMANGAGYAVKETPEEIAKMIFNAEHPQCKL